MSNRIEKIINEVRTDVSGKWVSIDDLENHTKSVVNECLDVIKKTPTSSAYTTFDMGVVKGTIEKSVDTVKKHFYEKK
jgi:hypothetical protein